MALRRKASLTDSGAALSTYTAAWISVLPGTLGLPDPEGACHAAQQGQIWEDGAGVGTDQSYAFPETLVDLFANLVLVGQYLRHGGVGGIVRAEPNDAVPVAGRNHGALSRGAGPKVAAEPGGDGGQVAPAGMIAVAAEILGRHLPVGRDGPLVDAANYLHAAFAPVEEHVQVPRGVAQVVEQRRSIGVESGEDQPLVAYRAGPRG